METNKDKISTSLTLRVLSIIIVVTVLAGAVVAVYYIEKITFSGNKIVTSLKTTNQPVLVDENASSTKRLAEIKDRINFLESEYLDAEDVYWKTVTELTAEEKDIKSKAHDKLVQAYYDEAYKLQTEYNQIQADLDKRLVSGVKNVDVGSIYDKYCSGPVSINYKNTDYSSELSLKLASLKIEDLANNLIDGVYLDNQTPEVLQYIALKLTQAGYVDDGIKIYKCDAEKYYDMVSMYRMVQIYKYGIGSYKKQFPDVVMADIAVDYKQAYFWVSAMFYVEVAEKTGLLNTSTQLGWNTIAMLDDLQETSKLTDTEMSDIEDSVRDFIGKRYPDVLNINMRVGSHKL